MSTFVDPFTDTGFKLLFGRENQSEEVLREFLNQLFQDDPDLRDIRTVTFLNNERVRRHRADKTILYDIFCETDSGHRFIVEMQREAQANFLQRASYYVARAITDQANRQPGDDPWDYDFLPVVGVFLCNFHVRGLQHKLLTRARLTDTDDGKFVGNHMRYVFLQLPEFKKTQDECTSEFDKLIYVIKNMNTLDNIPFQQYKNDVFARLDRLGRVAQLSDEDRDQYERDLKWTRDYHAQMKYATERGLAKGMAEGVAKGMAEGVAKGMAEGVSKGMAEGVAKGMAEGVMKVALEMKRQGFDVETISKITGIPADKL